MNLSFAELLIIVLFALLIVGPDKLPKAGKTIGKAVRQFREAQEKVNGKVNETLKREGLDPESVQEMARNPFLALEQLEKLDAVQSGDEPAAVEAVPADTQAEASPAPAVAEHKVVRLTERETFTERKARLVRERQEAQADAHEASAAEDDGEGGAAAL